MAVNSNGRSGLYTPQRSCPSCDSGANVVRDILAQNTSARGSDSESARGCGASHSEVHRRSDTRCEESTVTLWERVVRWVNGEPSPSTMRRINELERSTEDAIRRALNDR